MKLRRKVAGVFTAVFALTSCIAPNSVFAAISGDANSDGVVDFNDAANVLEYVLNKKSVSIDLDNSDVDGNTGITGLDSAYIIGKALNNDFRFPNENVTTEETTESTTEAPIDVKLFNLTGYGVNNTGGGSYDETDSKYRKVSTALEFDAAVKAANNKEIKVIEITNDLNLGYNEVLELGKPSKLSKHTSAIVSDALLESGVSKASFSGVDGLTIFSKNGAKLNHISLTFSKCKNIVIRNLEFDGLWEWDEYTKGNFDRNDWDYVTFQDSTTNAWVDHCTFNKAYDGIVDSKLKSNGIVISWCKIQGGENSEFYKNEMAQLEQEYQDDLKNGTVTRPMYYYLRNTAGFTAEEVAAIEAPQKKSHLVGHSNSDTTSSYLSINLYNNYYSSIQDRIPRLRGGNAHAFNLLIDSSDAYKAKQILTEKLKQKIIVDGSEITVEKDMNNKGYHFALTSQAALSTCGGAVKVENSHIIDVIEPFRFEQDKGYDGKILGQNIWYQLSDKFDFVGNSTDETANNINGESQENPLIPKGKGSELKEFSWNSEPTYEYESMLLDPTKLDSILRSKTGAGVQEWDTADWLKTSYTN